MSGPAYLIAAENHDILNSTGESWTDTILNIPKTVALGLGAGVNEIVNIPITVGNWFGDNTKQNDYAAVLQSYDSDLSKYYTQHKLGVDTIGFIAGSILPGMGGTKVLRAGQAVLRAGAAEGAIGSNLGRALGLLAPDSVGALAEATTAIRTSGSVFALTEANTLRALATGAWQSTLEAAAFETAVAATMYKSPILDQLSVSDLTWNIAIGTGVGGALGGLFTGVKTAYSITGAAKAAQKELSPFALTEVPELAAANSNKILFRMNQLDRLDNAPLPTTGDLVERAARMKEATRNKLLTDIRADFGALAGKDQGIAEALFQTSKLNTFDDNLRNFLDSTAAGRVGITSDIEANLNKLQKKVKDPTKAMTDEEIALFNDYKVNYIKIHGEDAGSVLTDRPGVLSLTDKLKSDQTITLAKNGNGVMVGSKLYTHDNNPHMPFNMFAGDHLRVESRYWWAEKLPRWVDDRVNPIQVNATDIPLLEKAYRDGLERLSVIPEGKAIKDAITLGTRKDIYDFALSQKLAIADRLKNAAPGKISAAEFIDKFKGLFGINFNLTNEANANYYGFFTRLSGKGGYKNTDLTGDVIALDQTQSLTMPLARMMRTLKHEEGHRTFQALLDSKGITAQNLETRWPLLYTEMRKIGAKLRPEYYKNSIRDRGLEVTVHEYYADTFYYMSRHPEMLDKNPAIKQAIGHLITPIPQEVIDAVSKRATKITPDEIAKIVNMEAKYLDGSAQRPGGEFARDMARKDYTARMNDAGVRESQQLEDPLLLPSYAKVISKLNHIEDTSGNELQGIAKVMQQTKLYDAASNRRATQILGEALPNWPDKDILLSSQAGPHFILGAEGNYGTASSVAGYVGQRTHALIKKAKEYTSELFTPTLSKVANSLDDSIEWSVLNEKLRNLPQRFFLHADGTKLTYGMEPIEANFGGDAKAFQKALQGYSELISNAHSAGIPLEIPIKGHSVRQLVNDHISRNAQRVVNRAVIRAGEGLPDNLDPMAFYPIPRNPKDTPFFAFVVDDSVTGTGHSKMIYAADAKGLEKLKNEVMQKMPEVRVLTKAESEAHFKAHGEFEFERTINENYINEMMTRRGVSASYLPMTDPSKIVNHFFEWHLARDSAGVREAVSHRYSRQFETLRQQASESLQAATSKIGYAGAMANLESMVDNPATNIIKMALDIQKTQEYPFWSSMNRLLDQKFSAMWARAGAVLSDATSPSHLQAINDSLQRAGYNGINGITEGMYEAMNATVPRGVLTGFINKANGLLATFALRMDPLNALNNAIGGQILLGTETASVIAAIKRGDKASVGALADLLHIAVPGQPGQTIQAPAKLIANSINRYHQNPLTADGTTKLKDYYKQHGFITHITSQYDQTLDALAISAGDTFNSLQNKLGKGLDSARRLGDAGEKLTGNTFAEEFNRFVAADVMKQLTDIAVAGGLMTEQTALSYINTFVNRTQGNFLASQRPLMFQGPVGQAMGLFQTYQFNLIQQITRHIGEGQTKNAGIMMGLQSVLYGANGLPGFSAINTNIIGNAPGNTNHTDLYRAMYNGAGKEAGDWLMYGLGSNWMSIFSSDLKNNLYSRGDINPRNISVVPANPMDYPIVQATGKMLSNIAETASKMSAGGDVWSTFLRGVEQNGVSRPLAGMAQVVNGLTSEKLLVTSLSSKGNVLMAHDVMNLASLTRIAGGKPLDEALTNDAMFRFNTYRAHDAAKKATLGEAIKLSILGGKEPDEAQINEFAANYTKAGGDQKRFSQFMMSQYKNANTSQANQLRAKLGRSESQSLQELMGGAMLEDVTLANQSALGAVQ